MTQVLRDATGDCRRSAPQSGPRCSTRSSDNFIQSTEIFSYVCLGVMMVGVLPLRISKKIEDWILYQPISEHPKNPSKDLNYRFYVYGFHAPKWH